MEGSMKYLVLLLLMTPQFLFAVEAEEQNSAAGDSQDKNVVEKASEEISKAADKIENLVAPETSRDYRSRTVGYGLINYAPLDLIIPSKIGLTLGWTQSADQSWEFEYLRGKASVPFVIEDLGSVTDERFSVLGRSYFGSNSFNLSYGLAYNKFNMHLGSAFLSGVSGVPAASIDLVDIQSVGFNIGIGNRWTFKHNITLSVDWISWSQPVWVTKDDVPLLDDPNANMSDSDREDVDDAKKWASYLPRLSLFKIQLGMMF